MFYICKKKETKLGVRFGVMDTEDGVVEYYTPRALLEFATNFGISIEGVLVDKQTGKLRIKVLNPASFNTVSEEECSTKSKTLMPLHVGNSTNKFKLTAGNSESLCRKLKQVFSEVLESNFDVKLPDRNLDWLDDFDCVGFEKIPVGDNTFLSIYSNPATNGIVYSADGFGIDFVDSNGHVIYDNGNPRHIDSDVTEEGIKTTVDSLRKYLKELPSKKEYISYSDPRVLKFARMAKSVARKLIYSNVEARLTSIKNVATDVSYWGEHHIISNVFEYDYWFDVIEQTDATLCISENKLTTNIIDIGVKGFWLVLSYDGDKYSVTKVTSNNLSSPVVEEILRFISPFGYYILRSGDVLFEGTEKELNAWIAGFEVLGTP